MELKHNAAAVVDMAAESINRTFMELKRVIKRIKS